MNWESRYQKKTRYALAETVYAIRSPLKCFVLQNSLYQRIYGKSANIDMVQPEKDVIIEYPELLNVAKERSAMNHSNEVKVDNHVAPEVAKFKPIIDAGVPKAPIPKQIETRTADGKRRITPMFIPLNQEEVS